MRTSARVALVALVAPMLVGAQSPAGTTPGPADIRQLAALVRTADARDVDTTVLDAGLASPTASVRALAALVAGQVHATSRVARLRELVADPDTAVAANAAFALGLLRDAGSTDALAAALGAPAGVATAAAWSLGAIGDSARVPLEGVIRTGTPAGALVPALVAASRLRPVPVALIVPHLGASDGDVRWAAVYALARGRAPGAAAALLTNRAALVTAGASNAGADAERMHDVRALLARGLARDAVGDSLAPSALAVLQALADDPHPHVRVAAVASIATYDSAGKPLVLACLEDPDANVRIAAARTLTAPLGLSTVDWTRAWAADTGFAYRRAVLLAAARYDVPLAQLHPSLPDDWRRNPDWRRRAAAAEAARALPFGRAQMFVSPLLVDDEGRVSASAWSTVAAALDSTDAETRETGREGLVGVLADPDPVVRAVIIRALARDATAAELPRFMQAYQQAAPDRDDDARLAALNAIAAIWRRDSANVRPIDRATIAGWPTPVQPPERAVLARIGLAPTWGTAPASDREAGWYEEQLRAGMIPALGGRERLAEFLTERGTITVALFDLDAPLTVANFVALAARGYFDGTRFHRVVPNFVAQDGDPRGDGGGGPGYSIRDELNRRWYERGAVGMALSGPDTGGSQYFFTLAPQPHLDGHYTVFATVRDGFDVLDRIVEGDRILEVRIK
jgi:cyclophilin family peptidyl-prolyl cis-trans isomerase